MRMSRVAHWAGLWTFWAVCFVGYTRNLRAEEPSHDVNGGTTATHPQGEPSGGHPVAGQDLQCATKTRALLEKLLEENVKNQKALIQAQAEFQALNAAHKASKDLTIPLTVAAEGNRLISEQDVLIAPNRTPEALEQLEKNPGVCEGTYQQVTMALAQGEMGSWAVAYLTALNALDKNPVRKGKALSFRERSRIAAREMRGHLTSELMSDKALVAQVPMLKVTYPLYQDLFPPLAPGAPELEHTTNTRLSYFKGLAGGMAKMMPKEFAFWETQFKLERDPQGYPQKLSAAYEALNKKAAAALPLFEQVYGKYLNLKKQGAITGQADPKGLTPEQLEQNGSLIHNALFTLHQDLKNDAPKRMQAIADQATRAAAASKLASEQPSVEHWKAATDLYNQWLQNLRTLVDEQHRLDNGLMLATVAELANQAAEKRAAQAKQVLAKVEESLAPVRAAAEKEEDPEVRKALLAKIEQKKQELAGAWALPMRAGDAVLEASKEMAKHMGPETRKGFVMNDDILYPEGSSATDGSTDFNPSTIQERVQKQREALNSLLTGETPPQIKFQLISQWVDSAVKPAQGRFQAIQKVWGGTPDTTKPKGKVLRGTPVLK